MTRIRFYRFALLVPLAVPAIAGAILGVAWLTASDAVLGSDAISIVLAVAYTGIFSTIPYAVFAIWAVRRLRRRALYPRRATLIVWLAPVLIGVPFALLLAARSCLAGECSGAVVGSVFFGFYALLIGYAYVVLIEAARVIGQLAGWIRHEEAAQAGLNSTQTG